VSDLKQQKRKTLAEDALNLPNLLTFTRVLMIPVCLYFLEAGGKRNGYFACLTFTIAAITDFFDGYLARKLNIVSVLGKLLDPLADKLIVMATLIYMVPMGRISAWAVVLLLGRELSITGLRSVAASEGVVISAGQDGKVKTALQMVGIIGLLLGYPYRLSYLGVDFGMVNVVRIGEVFIYLSLVFSLASAAQYVSLFSDAVDAKNKKLESARAPSESD
jgi:CDP-diacylglycerol---glycerol-3-phosphate 3-phosphatidyltransferase